ncbi:uncharacterized protein LOC125610217 [Brassica napus]|uniref:uncharacterized protein LOC125610217 n=1 Tax=Brassica napus TaxID=3708 RepID=UPI0020784E6A|nr:uncharacterized protein LOC125610217 [Brassica napus]
MISFHLSVFLLLYILIFFPSSNLQTSATADDDETGVEIAMRVVRFAKGLSAVTMLSLVPKVFSLGKKLQVEMMKLLHLFITSSKPVMDILLITTVGFYITLDGVNLLGHGAHKYLNNGRKCSSHFFKNHCSSHF